eukprot:305967_1
MSQEEPECKSLLQDQVECKSVSQETGQSSVSQKVENIPVCEQSCSDEILEGKSVDPFASLFPDELSPKSVKSLFDKEVLTCLNDVVDEKSDIVKPVSHDSDNLVSHDSGELVSDSGESVSHDRVDSPVYQK